ncbi:hypothetical protein [Streptomyces sp. NPDC058486]|uniref:hypothetical protein n=1 Tax=unclassified Streptomyces TaxID=2593676 RepID=UPI003649535B
MTERPAAAVPSSASPSDPEIARFLGEALVPTAPSPAAEATALAAFRAARDSGALDAEPRPEDDWRPRTPARASRFTLRTWLAAALAGLSLSGVAAASAGLAPDTAPPPEKPPPAGATPSPAPRPSLPVARPSAPAVPGHATSKARCQKHRHGRGPEKAEPSRADAPSCVPAPDKEKHPPGSRAPRSAKEPPGRGGAEPGRAGGPRRSGR